MRFTKMHGIGNDYLFINCFDQTVTDPSALAVAMSKPHFGAGSDGIVLICPSKSADFAMRMYNLDGSEGKMCGNAARCIGRYVYERGLTNKTEIDLDTAAGIRHLSLKVQGEKVLSIQVDMGRPSIDPEAIPVLLPPESSIGYPLTIDGQDWKIHCISMGNPHCVVFVEDCSKLDLASIGPKFEHHALFPERINTEFVQIIERDHLKMRVWERGSGETLACGTGACASLAAAVLTGRSERKVTMDLLGGSLSLFWDESTGHIYQEGPAEFVYDAEWLFPNETQRHE